ncbi:DUF6531 domain-containing protein, partial [Burkholderia gladioli]
MKTTKISHFSRTLTIKAVLALITFALYSLSFEVQADDSCWPLYARSSATPGSPTCQLDVVSTSPAGMGDYACINDIASIEAWCANASSPNKQEPDLSCPVADPVYPGNGAVTLEATDFVSGDDWPMFFTRTYNSQRIEPNGNSMGRGWHHNWQRYLDLKNATNTNELKIIAYREDGQPVTFNWSENAWRTYGTPSLELERNHLGNWILRDLETDAVESYLSSGILLSETTYSHTTRTLTYDSSGLLTALTQHGAALTTGYDSTLQFDYDNKRRLSRLTDPLGNTTRYGYDTNDNLVSITWPDGNVHRYLYENSNFKNALTGEINEIGTRITTWTYDEQGRAVAVTHPESARDVQFTYHNGSTVITGRAGITTLNMSPIGGSLRPTTIISAAGNASSKWDASGKLISDSDASGGTRKYSYDNAGRPIKVVFNTPTVNSVITLRYADSSSLRPLMISSPNLIQAFDYNPYLGNVLTIRKTPTTDSTGASGLAALRDVNAATTTYKVEYGPANWLIGVRETVDGKDSRRWKIIRDFTDNVYQIEQIVDGATTSTTMQLRDAAHRVLRGKNPSGEFSLKYNSRGWITDFTFNEYANPSNGNARRKFNVRFNFSPDGRITSRSGTVSTNDNTASHSISEEEINQWIDNYNHGDSPVGPSPGIQKSRQRTDSSLLPPSTVCSDCHFSAGLGGVARGIAFVWKLVKNPATKHGIGKGTSQSKEISARLRANCKPSAEQIPGIPPGRAVKDITVGRSVKNVETDLGRAEFEANLTKDGWTHSLAKDGKTDIFTKNGDRFTVRNDSNAGMPTAEYIPVGATKATLKIRLPNP